MLRFIQLVLLCGFHFVTGMKIWSNKYVAQSYTPVEFTSIAEISDGFIMCGSINNNEKFFVKSNLSGEVVYMKRVYYNEHVYLTSIGISGSGEFFYVGGFAYDSGCGGTVKTMFAVMKFSVSDSSYEWGYKFYEDVIDDDGGITNDLKTVGETDDGVIAVGMTSGIQRIMVIRLNLNGEISWAHTLGNSKAGHSHTAHAVEITDSGEYVFVGFHPGVTASYRGIIGYVGTNGNLIEALLTKETVDDFRWLDIVTFNTYFHVSAMMWDGTVWNIGLATLRSNLHLYRHLGLVGDGLSSEFQTNPEIAVIDDDTTLGIVVISGTYGQNNGRQVFLSRIGSNGAIESVRYIPSSTVGYGEKTIATSDGGVAFAGRYNSMPWAGKFSTDFENSGCGAAMISLTCCTSPNPGIGNVYDEDDLELVAWDGNTLENFQRISFTLTVEDIVPSNSNNDNVLCFNCFGEKTPYQPSECSDHGVCIGFDNCSCLEDYYGKRCQLWDCDGKPAGSDCCCSNHGVCSSSNNCTCAEDGYTAGEYCELWECKDVEGVMTEGHLDDLDARCSSHGRCIEHNTCACDVNYQVGEFCEKWSCKDVYGSPQIGTGEGRDGIRCSGHGICTGFGECSCDPNYTSGEYCQKWSCRDVQSTLTEGTGEERDSRRCSGHGTCVQHDSCTCDAGYELGNFCQLWRCRNSNNSLIVGNGDERDDQRCSGHGICIKMDNCSCDSGYVHGNCGSWKCGDLFGNHTEACSGRGQCVAPQECVCFSGYDGEFCRNWDCYGNDCSGNGICSKPDNCVCDILFYGKDCAIDGRRISIFAGSGVGGVLLLCGICMCVTVLFCCVISILCVMCCCSVCVCVCQACFGLSQKNRVSTFERLDDFDHLLKEQMIEKDSSMPHLTINKDLFVIDYDELKIVKSIGEGGSDATVFLATFHSKNVAFKCFRTKKICSSQDNFNQFEAEVNLLVNINHPNIIHFIGATMKVPRVGIVMEYCENGECLDFILDYRDRTEDRTAYPLSEKIRMAEEIASSICYIHSRNIVHRDIKTENILVDSSERCKLMDFGISRFLKDGIATTRRIGTNIYMAPEVSRGDEYDSKCDSFSYAILLWIILVEEESPYREEGGGAVEYKVANDSTYRPDVVVLKSSIGDYFDVADRREGVRKFQWLVDMIVTCWDERPSERYNFREILAIFTKETKQ